jgi:hypothetical protein
MSKETNNKKSKPVKPEPEYCVGCGKETKYTKATPIDCRIYYVEGGGQLCLGCGRAIYA